MSLCSRSPRSAPAHPQNRGDTGGLVSYLLWGENVNIRRTDCVHICRLTLSSGGFCEGQIEWRCSERQCFHDTLTRFPCVTQITL